MPKPKRVKVLDCQFQPAVDLIVITMFDVAAKETVKLGFRSLDIFDAFGLKTDKKMPTEVVQSFCEAIKGKEINWVCETTYKDLSSSLSPDDMLGVNQELGKYPFAEVAELEE